MTCVCARDPVTPHRLPLLTHSVELFISSLSVGHNLWLFSWQRKNPDAPRSVFLQLKERKNKELRA
jgi:hypothetical protein